MLKTRRRKGLGDQIAVSKYLDDEFVVRRVAVSRWYVLIDDRSSHCRLRDTRICLDRVSDGDMSVACN